MKKIKVFHVNDHQWKSLNKGCHGQYYKFRFAWGGIVTNKACRTNERFTMLFCPNGTRVNQINYNTFKHFFCEEEYKPEHIRIDPKEIDELKHKLKRLPQSIREEIIEEVNNEFEYEEDCE